MRLQLVLVAGLGVVTSARADAPAPSNPSETAPSLGAGIDAGAIAEQGAFGPRILIERIEIVGNGNTRRELILRALPFSAGDELAAGDPRLSKARFKVLALGFFRDVTMSMQRGSSRGRVVITIQLEERGTVVLNRLWFGSSTIAPWWAGADLSERNLLGTGLTIGGGWIFASHDEVQGSRDQWAAEARLAVPSLHGSAWSAFASLALLHGSEAYRVGGDSDDTDAANFRAFAYRRVTGRGGATYDLSALSRVTATLRGEWINAQLPLTPTRVLGDGRVAPVDLHLRPDASRLISASLAYDRDNRPDPVLPHAGSRLTVSAELSGQPLASSYTFVTLLARYEHWWPLRVQGHAIGLHLGGGAIVGEAPRFDWIQLSDVNRMLQPRALGLLVSANAPISFLGTATDKRVDGEFGAAATVEYVYRLFNHGAKRIYGGDLFVGTGLWALSDADGLRARDRSLWRSLPIDLFLDAGLRIDTDIGVFELTVANALGRVPR
jgi:outer membrane protein insertion porin family